MLKTCLIIVETVAKLVSLSFLILFGGCDGDYSIGLFSCLEL